MFYEQLKKACAHNCIPLTTLLKRLDLSTANTGKWKNGGMPSVEVLLKLSAYLGVSTDYLLGLKTTYENKENEEKDMKRKVAFFSNPTNIVLRALRLEQNVSESFFVAALNMFASEEGLFEVPAPTITKSPDDNLSDLSYAYRENLRVKQFYSPYGLGGAKNSVPLLKRKLSVESYVRIENEDKFCTIVSDKEKVIVRRCEDSKYDIEDNVAFGVIDFFYQKHFLGSTITGALLLPPKYKPLSEFMLRVAGVIDNKLNDITIENIAERTSLEKISIEKWLNGESEPNEYCTNQLRSYLFPNEQSRAIRAEIEINEKLDTLLKDENDTKTKLPETSNNNNKK